MTEMRMMRVFWKVLKIHKNDPMLFGLTKRVVFLP